MYHCQEQCREGNASSCNRDARGCFCILKLPYMEPSWMRVEPAINAGVAHSIYVGGATGSMGSLQKLLALHKTQEPMPPAHNSCALPATTPNNAWKTPRRGTPGSGNSEHQKLLTAACPCLPLSVSRRVKKKGLRKRKLHHCSQPFLLLIYHCGELFPATLLNRPPCVHHQQNGHS